MKRLGHKVVANTHAGQRAFDSLDDRRRVAPDLIQRIADVHDLGVKLAGSGSVAAAGGFTELDVELGEEVCAARDTTVTASEERIGQKFLRSNEQRPVRATL